MGVATWQTQWPLHLTLQNDPLPQFLLPGIHPSAAEQGNLAGAMYLPCDLGQVLSLNLGSPCEMGQPCRSAGLLENQMTSRNG